MDAACNIFSAGKKRYLIGLLGLLLALSLDAFSQGCNCPPVTVCNQCTGGGLISLTLRYNGFLPGLVIATEGDGNILFTGLVGSGGTFTITGTDSNGRFEDDEVNISVLAIPNASFDTDCNAGVFVNSTFGSFTVVAGVSKSGGPICCASNDDDATPPQIFNCPANVIRSAGATCTATATWIAPTATDNCGGVTISSPFASGNTFPLGTTPVVYTATDDYGNTATCTFNVIVNDNTNPVISGCPTNIIVSADAGACGTAVTWAPPTATDNCTTTPARVSNHNPGDFFGLGTTLVTYTFTDGAGNNAVCNFNVTVNDNTDPVITGCPANIIVTADIGSCGTNVNWVEPTATDNCTATPTRVRSHAPATFFPVGTTPVTYTFTDAAGNDAVCTFNVTVNDITPPVITGCPANIITNANPGACGTNVPWTPPTAIDNCSATPTLVNSHSPGAFFPVGTTAVTYTFTDPSGNNAVCTFNVTVNDITPPVITGCPVNIIMTADPGACGRNVPWTPPTALDNCSATPTLVNSHSPGSFFPVGTTAVTYTFTDPSGNNSVCTFNVTINDITPPVITGCPVNIIMTADPGACGRNVPWTPPTALDNCSATPTLVNSHSPGAFFPVGTTPVTYTFTDPSGNNSVCTFNVTINDITPPVITGCPTNIIITADPGTCGRNVPWTPPTALDNCSATPTLVNSHSPGAFFPVGTTPVTYTFTDPSGNNSVCTFNVTVNDVTPPVITGCPVNIITTANPGACGTNVPWTPPTALDNCSATPTLVNSHSPGAFFPVGTTVVSYTFTDPSGNNSVCTFNITVNDITPPVITGCPVNIIMTADPGACGRNVPWTPPTALDNCSATPTLVNSHSPGAFFPVGTTAVTYTFTDPSGNSSVCTFNVTVNDITPPVITGCPVNIIMTADPGACGRNVPWTPPTALDNCSATPTLVNSHSPGAFFPVGTTAVTYTFTDPSGNNSVCTFNVTVNDITPPVISGCPVNIIMTADPGACGRNVPWTPPTALDNCSATPTLVNSHSPGAFFPVGTTPVTYTFTDPFGNSSVCTFNVTVNDITPPVITGCPVNIITTANPGACGTNVPWTPPTAIDNCSATPTLVNSHSPGSFFPVGTTVVTYTFTDPSGNNSICTFNVTVNDITPPVITGCPVNIIMTADPGACGRNVPWTPPTALDNCSATPTLVNSHSPGAFFPLGTTAVTYTFTDPSGNNSVCTFNVTINDVTPPVISGCPSNIVLSASAGACGRNVTWTPPTALDNCSATPTLVNSHSPGAFFPVGTTPVTYTFTDPSGNNSVCTFNVTINDVTPPVITGCPSNIVVTADAGACGKNVTWTPPTALDNCSATPALVNSHNSGAFFPVGTTPVTYTFTDPSGNNSVCTFNVIVNDVTPPVISGCPVNIIVPAGAGSCGANVPWVPPTATDNCIATPTVVSTHSPGAFFPVGITTPVTYTFTDPSGNSTTCTFNITVNDTTSPVITGCPGDIIIPANGSCEAVATWTIPNASDNCTLTFSGSHNSGGTFPIGTTLVTYTATDGAGNVTLCTFNVTVQDDADPLISGCPSNIVVTGGDDCLATVTWTPPTASDNCNVTLTSNRNPGQSFVVGTTNVTYTATDDAGNVSTCSFNISVEDHNAPVFDCLDDIIVISCGSMPVLWTPPTISDCSGYALTRTHSPGDLFPVGETTVTYTADDLRGNISSCSFKVIVRDLTPPSIQNCPGDITINAVGCGIAVTWAPVTATDNCGPAPLTSSHASGQTFPVGTTPVEFEATDVNGNTSTCTFNVIVKDITIPVILGCPTNIVIAADAGACGRNVTWTAPTAVDNCTATPAMVNSHEPGAFFPVGTTPVTYTFTDPSGNVATCSFTVTVNDNSGPVISGCPTNIVVTSDDNSCGRNVTWIAPTAIDNCTATPTMVNSHSSGNFFPVGTTPVTYTFTDAVGNSSVCTFNVTVNDTTDPDITGCPQDITVSAGTTGCGINVNWTAPTATDNCTASPTVVNNRNPGSFFAIGTTPVNYTFTDLAGNSATCSFNVTVVDDTDPVINGCPSDITVSTGSCDIVVNWVAPTASDLCGIALFERTHSPGQSFSAGTTRVEYVATDVHGNTTTCGFNVIVQSTVVPILSECPGDLTGKAGESGEVEVTWQEPVGSSGCGDVVVTSTHAPGDPFPVGTTVVTYSATDQSGTSATCSFNVVVVYKDIEIAIPTVVTPDGNGANDEWVVGNIEEFRDNKVMIVDRWGSVIYKASGYNNSSVIWTGTNSGGTLVPTGTYFFTIEVTFKGKHLEKRGFIELIR